MRSNPVVVIGGGLGGLTCALLLARAGRQVALYEKSSALGGRAASQEDALAWLNLGPHALYRTGAGRALLRELGVDPAGGRPPASGGLAFDRGKLHALPVGLASMLTTSLLGLAEKREAARVLAKLGKWDPSALRDQTVNEWIDAVAARPGTRKLLHALVRVTSYVNAPHLAGAEDTVAQVQRGLLDGVMYIDGGWQSIVDALRDLAVRAGVAIHTSTRVAQVAPGQVKLVGGGTAAAAAVVIAASPSAARSLLPTSAALAAAERDAVPVRAACLDLVLYSLPRSRATFCLGIDQPLYYSVHTAAARLAQDNRQVVHVARYLAPGEEADASSLEAFLDLLQPGWRERVLARRFLPRLVVANDLAPIGRRRPGPAVPDAAGVFLVGDWVGEGAMLADATLASARAAASCILTEEQKVESAPARPRPSLPAETESLWS